MKSNKAIVTGSNGQDGYFICELLKNKGYDVYEVPSPLSKDSLQKIITDFRPTEIYNFAGYSNTFNPYADMDRMIESNFILPKNLLEIIVEVNPSIKFFQASSCLIFGKDESGFQNEMTIPNPIHPYGLIKLAAQNLVRIFREDKGLFACSAILFPHESSRRKQGFFTKKIVSAVVRIKNGSTEKIKISWDNQWRDWGWAPDYVDACYLMLHHHTPIDFVVGSGIITTLNDFISRAFNYVGLNWLDYVEEDSSIVRKNDLNALRADISKIKTELGWYPKSNIDEIIGKMIDSEKII